MYEGVLDIIWLNVYPTSLGQKYGTRNETRLAKLMQIMGLARVLILLILTIMDISIRRVTIIAKGNTSSGRVLLTQCQEELAKILFDIEISTNKKALAYFNNVLFFILVPPILFSKCMPYIQDCF